MDSSPTYGTIIVGKWPVLLASGLAGLCLALLVSLFQPLEYRAEASIMVIPGFTGDGYQASRSAEKYATTLTSILPSMSFYQKVAVADPRVTGSFQGSDTKVRRAWKKAIDGTVKPNTGIVDLKVYTRERLASEEVMAAVLRVLEEEGASYLGGNASVLLYTINQPLVSRFPVRPNYPVNLLGGFVFGVLISAVVLVARSELRVSRTSEVVREAVRVQPTLQPIVREREAPKERGELPSVHELIKQRFGYEPREIRALVEEPVDVQEEQASPLGEREEQPAEYTEQREPLPEPEKQVFTPEVVNLLKINRDLRESGQWSASAHRESENV